MLEKIKFEKFTAFENLEVRFSPGMNIFVGENGTGKTHILKAAYIPVKDMMANAPGFRSLYEEREIHFEEIYVDIIRKAFLPVLKGPTDKPRKQLLDSLQEAMDGKVVAKNEEFFLRSKHGELEFTLLAEGFRKMGLLWILIQNGTLLNGSTLFWDEPETNLNPRLMKTVVGILLALQRLGVQIFLTTHDYVVLKEIDLQSQKDDKIKFHSLYRNSESGELEVSSTARYLDISPNAIDDTFGSFVDREIEKSMGGLGKKKEALNCS
jgi:predicted ATP-dependent endonuclease of OLD family